MYIQAEARAEDKFFLLLLSLFVFTGSAYMEMLPSSPSYLTLVYCCLACTPSVFASSQSHGSWTGGNASTCCLVFLIHYFIVFYDSCQMIRLGFTRKKVRIKCSWLIFPPSFFISYTRVIAAIRRGFTKLKSHMKSEQVRFRWRPPSREYASSQGKVTDVPSFPRRMIYLMLAPGGIHMCSGEGGRGGAWEVDEDGGWTFRWS